MDIYIRAQTGVITVIEKFVMSLDFKNKKGMIHRQTCDYAKTQDRLLDSGRLLTEQLTGWFGPWDTYDEARAIAIKMSFKVWDCSRCNPK
jgi:hypothetical protein